MSPNWDLGIVNEARERPRVSYEQGREGKHTDECETLVERTQPGKRRTTRETAEPREGEKTKILELEKLRHADAIIRSGCAATVWCTQPEEVE